MLALILASLQAVASADILAWTDSAGVTHYTNLKGDVPSQQAVQVVVDEQIWLAKGSAVPVAEADPVIQPEPPVETEDDVLRAYVAGLESGLSHNVSTGGNVYINGPLAVTISAPTPYSGYFVPGYDRFLWGYYPYVARSAVGWHHGPPRRRIGGFHTPFPFYQRFNTPAGPPPFGAAGPPPLGAAGPPPGGAAGRSTVRVVGSPYRR